VTFLRRKKVTIPLLLLVVLIVVAAAAGRHASNQTVAGCFRAHGWRIVSGDRAFPPDGRQGVAFWGPPGGPGTVVYTRADRQTARACLRLAS